MFLHKKTVHEGLKDYACANCEKKFVNKSNLFVHQKTIHESQKAFATNHYSDDLCGMVYEGDDERNASQEVFSEQSNVKEQQKVVQVIKSSS